MNIDKDITLPQQYKDLLSSAIKFYEQKKYDKAVRNCDKILAAHPDHCETKAIKALVLNQKGEHQSAMRLSKEALMKGLSNFTCWHIFGILNRSAKKNQEALKAYLKAHSLDQKNQQVLRDMAQLQIQLGDFEGYLESRIKLLEQKSDQLQNWIGRGVAEYLVGHYQTCFNLFERVLSNVEDNRDFTQVHRSETLTFMGRCLLMKEKYQDSIQFLLKNDSQIREKEKQWEFLVQAAKQAQNGETQRTYLLKLIERNPQDYEKILAFSELGKSEISTSERVKELNELSAKFPKSRAIQKLILKLQEVDNPEGRSAFKSALKLYISPLILKGFPSLIAQLKFIYPVKEKALILQELLEQYEAESQKNKDPAIDLWVLYFLACHYDRLRELDKAREYIEKAIGHTPTLVDLYTMKARIIKHSGDLVQAADIYNFARELDQADRYLNAKCAKYYLRIGEIKQADQEMKKFVKDPVTGLLNCHEMQCMWWECELGDAARVQGDLLLALKNYKQVEIHFQSFNDDQYEFHNYCLRKNQLNVYVDMQAWQQKLKKNHFFVRAVVPLFKVLDAIYRRSQEFDKVVQSSKAEIDKLEEVINKSRGEDEWRRPDRDPKGLVMLKHVLSSPKEIKEQRLKFARDLIDFNFSSELALYSGFKETLNAGALAYSLKALLELRKHFQDKAKFRSAVVRLRRKIQEKASSIQEVTGFFESEIAELPSEQEAIEWLRSKSEEDLEACYYYFKHEGREKGASLVEMASKAVVGDKRLKFKGKILMWLKRKAEKRGEEMKLLNEKVKQELALWKA